MEEIKNEQLKKRQELERKRLEIEKKQRELIEEQERIQKELEAETQKQLEVLKILKNKKLARKSEAKIAGPPVNLHLDKQINFDEKKQREPPKEVQHRKIK